MHHSTWARHLNWYWLLTYAGILLVMCFILKLVCLQFRKQQSKRVPIPILAEISQVRVHISIFVLRHGILHRRRQLLRSDILLPSVCANSPDNTVRKNDFLTARWMVCFCLTVGEIEDFNAIGMCCVPGVHLTVVVLYSPCSTMTVKSLYALWVHVHARQYASQLYMSQSNTTHVCFELQKVPCSK